MIVLIAVRKSAGSFDVVDGNARGARSGLSLRYCIADLCAASGPSEGLRPPQDDISNQNQR